MPRGTIDPETRVSGPASFTPMFAEKPIGMLRQRAHAGGPLNKALVATQLNSSTSTAHKLTPRVHTLLATACN